MFADAKRLSLVAFFEQNVAPPTRINGSQAMFDNCPGCGPARQKARDRVSVRVDSKWHCFACGAGGTIVDAAALLWNVEPLEAARRLTHRQTEPPVHRDDRKVERWRAQDDERQQALRQALQVIFDATRRSWDLGVEHYLLDRGISRDVIVEAGQRGLLGALPSDPDPATEWLLKVVGPQLLEGSGLWKRGKPRPWVAYRPLVFFPPGLSSAEFRVIPRVRPDRMSETKSISVGRHEAPYWWSRASDRCLVVEGMIDLMSALVLGFEGCIIGVAGVANWRIEWFQHAAKRHGIRSFQIAFDNDVDSDVNHGQIAAQKLLQACTDAGLSVSLCPPLIGDLNDLLQTQLAARARAMAATPSEPTY